jgi:hypothetical protein
MRILWIKKLKKNKPTEEKSINTESSFSDHDEDMRRFRQLHQELQMVINKDMIAADGSILAPIHGVRLAKNSQN